MMELYQLRTFVAVAELQHLTQAAERLHVSQPAASAHIKALEEALGVALFERRAGRLALTAAGRELLGYAREVLGAAAALRAKAREIAGAVTGKFRLGSLFDTSLVRLGEFVHAARSAYAELDLEIHQLSSLNIIGGLQSGELDAGFALFGHLPSGVGGLVLRRLAYRVVAPAAWSERVDNADLAALAALPWIGSPRGGSHDQMLMSLFGEAELHPNRVVEGDHEGVLASLVEAGVGLSLMREDRARAAAERGVVVIWDGPPAHSTLRFVYAEWRVEDPVVRALRELAADLWADVLSSSTVLRSEAGSGTCAK